jgi:uncharacterized protein involved in exopolysaccharide biosynthesis
MEKEKNNFGFISFLDLISRWRMLFIVNFIVIAAASIIISFQLEKWYTATAVVIPPSDQQAGGGLASLLSTIPLASMGMGLSSGGEMTYMALLKSKSLATEVIDRYNLREFYEQETLEETFLSFYADYDAQLTEENMIAISFEYTDSVKVAEIVNFIVDWLGRRATELKIQRAEITKEFIEERYFQNLKDIDSAAVALQKFQTEHGIIEFEEQTKALINVNAEIESKIFLKETEAEVLRNAYGENSPQYRGAKNELDVLHRKLEELIKNKNEPADSPFSSLYVPFDKIPDLGKQYAALYSEYLIQTKLQEYLLPEYEQAKLQLMKDKPTLQVIDYAYVPDKKSRPKKAFVILGAVFVSSVIAFLFVLFLDRLRWMKEHDKEKYAALIKIKNMWLFKS